MYVPRPELGTKRLCVSCAVRFYDLSRVPAQCPACKTEQPPVAQRSRPVPRAPGARWQGRTPPRADVAAVVAIADRLGALMLARPDLEEIEINPILVRTQGAVAVDSFIRKEV